jgi:hypothetical protein
MKKLVLAGISILAVCLLVLGSLSNVVGFQTVQTSQQNLIKERVDQKDLLFQTICDVANNQDVQKTILQSQGKFLTSFPTPELTSFPTVTKKQLNMMYCLGIVLSRMIGKNRMVSMAKEHPKMSVQTKEKFDAIIENNPTLSQEMTQLSLLDCPSCSESKINWTFPVICTILFPIFVICFIIALLDDFIFWPLVIIDGIGLMLHCFWAI